MGEGGRLREYQGELSFKIGTFRKGLQQYRPRGVPNNRQQNGKTEHALVIGAIRLRRSSRLAVPRRIERIDHRHDIVLQRRPIDGAPPQCGEQDNVDQKLGVQVSA